MNTSKWIELAVAACDDAGVVQDSIEIITNWEQTFSHNDLFRNNAVFRLSDKRILKLYGTDAQRHFNIERAVLQSLDNQIPAPRLIAEGSLENGSPYIIMTEVSGKTLQDSWDGLRASELKTIAREIGTITANLHQQAQDKLAVVEAQFGGRHESISEQEAARQKEIEASSRFSKQHKQELLNFLHGEGKTFLELPPVLTHADFSHAHIYVLDGKVSGFIDWGEAMLGPADWDIAFHWLWTFSQDKDTMRECLNAYYQGMPRPEHFARRCFASHFYTFSMEEVWDYFTDTVDDSESIVRAMIKSLFPEDVFGNPD